MLELVVIYQKPNNESAFVSYMLNFHLPLIQKFPYYEKISFHKNTDSYKLSITFMHNEQLSASLNSCHGLHWGQEFEDVSSYFLTTPFVQLKQEGKTSSFNLETYLRCI